MSKITSTRVSAGFYKVSDGRNTVQVSTIELDDGVWWMATAEWDRHRYSDPMYTKRECMEIAKRMLETADKF